MKKSYARLMIVAVMFFSMRVQESGAQCILFSEDFATAFGSNFTSSNNTGGSTWAFTSSCSASNLAGHSAPGSVIFQGITVPCQFGNSTSTVSGDLNTPVINISAAGTTLLNFNYYLLNECTGVCQKDKLSVGISTNGGGTFTTIMDSYSTGGLAPTAGAWVSKSYNLSAYAGQNIMVRFSFNSYDGTANAFDGVYIDDVIITATAGPAKPVAITGPAAVCMNTSATYTISPVTAASTYTWSVPAGASITSGQGTTSVTIAFGTTSGNISVAASNSCGTSAAKTFSVSVSVPSIAASASSPSICQGDITQMTAVSNVPAAGTFTLGTGTLTNTSTSYPAPYGNYYWGARHQMLITAAELTALGMVAGEISSLSFDVSAVNSAPVHQGFTIQMGSTSLSSITTFQSGLSTVFGPVDYQPVVGWNKHTFSTPFIWNGTSNIIVETCFNNSSYTTSASVRQSTTSYTSTVYHNQDASGICASSTISSTKSQRPNMKFDAATSMTYTWSPASGLSNSSVANPVASPSVTTTYTVTGTSSCGSVSAAVTITVNPAVTAVNAGSDITICEGWTAMLNGSNTGGVNYLWSTGQTTASISVAPSVSSTYTLVVSNSSGCSKSDEVTVTVNPSGTANAGADMKICSGQTILLNGSGNGSYSWSPQTGLSCPTCANTGASPSVTTTYTLTVSNNCGSVSDAVTVTVDAATSNAGNDVTICPTGSTQLSAVGNGSYTWVPATGLSCTNCSNPVASPNATTTYTLTVQGSCGNSSDEITVTVDPSATTNAHAGADTTICVNDSITLMGTGSGSYNWSPASGLSCTTCANPVASPSVTTTYTLMVTSSCGSASDDVTLTVDPCVIGINAGVLQGETKIIPNPGVGLFLLVPGEAILGEVEMKVLNVQGEVVYSARQVLKKNESAEIDLTGTPAGIYFLKVNTDNGILTRKIMIMH